jgi:hypothetical protein
MHISRTTNLTFQHLHVTLLAGGLQKLWTPASYRRCAWLRALGRHTGQIMKWRERGKLLDCNSIPGIWYKMEVALLPDLPSHDSRLLGAQGVLFECFCDGRATFWWILRTGPCF